VPKQIDAGTGASADGQGEIGPTSTRGVVIGIDIGGTKTALMATDIATGQELATDTCTTDTDAGPQAMTDQIVDDVATLLATAGRDREELRAVGIAVPGHVAASSGRVITAGNLSGWADIPFRDLIARKLDVPIWVDQDANAAALGEHWRGAAKEMNNFVFLALGTGVGCGLMINGRLRRGYHHAAGEVGNFVMGRDFLGRKQDHHGNLELLVGGPAIRERGRAATGEDLSAAEILVRAASDERLAEIAADVTDHIAIATIAIVALLDPEAIIFGGGTAEAGEHLIDPVRERVEQELTMRPALMRSVLGKDAQLHGAVFGALWQLDPNLALREELR